MAVERRQEHRFAAAAFAENSQMLGVGGRVVAGEDVLEGHWGVLVGWVVFEPHLIEAVQMVSGAAGGAGRIALSPSPFDRSFR